VSKLQDEAARALSEAPALRLRAGAAPPALPDMGEAEHAGLCEVADRADRLLMCMPVETARRKALGIRICALALRSREGRLILRKKARVGAARRGLWDIYSCHLRVGEAREDAVLRLLAEEGGLAGLKAEKVADVSEGTNGAHISFFTADLPPGLYPAHAPGEVLEVDRDELDGLVENTPELLSGELICAAGIRDLLR
jgi:ADP-ribose pyrophosphatase YjhB (NUDIX family)